MDDIKDLNSFSNRHIGLDNQDIDSMLETIGYKDMVSFIESLVPEGILSNEPLNLDNQKSEKEALEILKEISNNNKIFKSYIGQGYFNTLTPNVIQRNVFENPGWYTSYTPYQPEISQGRLEALINFQTMVSDLTGMQIANASLLDEATAAAEAMMLAKRISKSNSNTFFVDEKCFKQTINVILTRAEPLNIDVIIGDPEESHKSDYFGIIFQYPNSEGEIRDFSKFMRETHDKKAISIFASDLLALTLIKPPGEFGADIVIGSSQRFGVPLGFGGPHAAFMATNEKHQRSLPGRIVGASIDVHGRTAYRLALQTREQHIRREKATSNICTAQALLAIMAGFYAVYHGPKGLSAIAKKVNNLAVYLATAVSQEFQISNNLFFDTVVIHSNEKTEGLIKSALDKEINLRKIDKTRIGISIDETTTLEDVELLISIFIKKNNLNIENVEEQSIPKALIRKTKFLEHSVFHKYQSETEMMRYIRKLSDKDIALDRSMIPLGSCTMKLNSASEMVPVSWPEFSSIHPFAPLEQTKGYEQLINELKNMLISITGYEGISLQPNAGSQGEYAGLLAIKAFHKSKNEERNICLIPSSAHGTNPASAQMVGMDIVPINCGDDGNIDLQDLREKSLLYEKNLAAIMITYPSTHGVFESSIKEVCKIIHESGGLVYIDGANFNAMVGLCYPGKFGGDVSHLNLHKTFCIPHGGGGPGVGPIGVIKDLIPFLPGHHEDIKPKKTYKVGPVAGSDWGSASILPISWMYIKMMGSEGLKKATEVAILNTNYIAKRLDGYFPILYKGNFGLVAHECIIDVRPLKESAGIEVEDIAKRLIDYGFHAPTMSWPVGGTLMIEPTESESKEELDRFCEAMISIRKEIKAIESGISDKVDNVLKNAPHTASCVSANKWGHKYSREEAAYPIPELIGNKYWPPVGRVDNVYGDRNLMCSCPSMEDFE